MGFVLLQSPLPLLPRHGLTTTSGSHAHYLALSRSSAFPHVSASLKSEPIRAREMTTSQKKKEYGMFIYNRALGWPLPSRYVIYSLSKINLGASERRVISDAIWGLWRTSTGRQSEMVLIYWVCSFFYARAASESPRIRERELRFIIKDDLKTSLARPDYSLGHSLPLSSSVHFYREPLMQITFCKRSSQLVEKSPDRYW